MTHIPLQLILYVPFKYGEYKINKLRPKAFHVIVELVTLIQGFKNLRVIEISVCSCGMLLATMHHKFFFI